MGRVRTRNEADVLHQQNPAESARRMASSISPPRGVLFWAKISFLPRKRPNNLGRVRTRNEGGCFLLCKKPDRIGPRDDGTGVLGVPEDVSSLGWGFACPPRGSPILGKLFYNLTRKQPNSLGCVRARNEGGCFASAKHRLIFYSRVVWKTVILRPSQNPVWPVGMKWVDRAGAGRPKREAAASWVR